MFKIIKNELSVLFVSLLTLVLFLSVSIGVSADPENAEGAVAVEVSQKTLVVAATCCGGSQGDAFPRRADALSSQVVGRGDFNRDGANDIEDVKLMSLAINAATTDLLYDLNGDGTVNAADGMEWLTMNCYWPADFDLNGQVDVTDLSTWSTGFGSSTVYVGGDANFDGQVDVTDQSLWAVNFGKQSSQGCP